MLYPALEEKLRKGRLALDGATSESIIELCKQYLALLSEYRTELYTLPNTLDLNRHSKTSSRVESKDIRKEVRDAIEHTTSEREWAEALILWFTAISGYGAVETLNKGKFRGHDNWELRAGGVKRSSGGTGSEKMTIQDAVDAASLLRREEHIAQTAAQRASSTNDAVNISGGPELTRVFEGSAR